MPDVELHFPRADYAARIAKTRAAIREGINAEIGRTGGRAPPRFSPRGLRRGDCGGLAGTAVGPVACEPQEMADVIVETPALEACRWQRARRQRPQCLDKGRERLIHDVK